MKKYVEIAWNSPINEELFVHLRNDMRFNEDHINVFDSVTHHSGSIEFHVDNTGFDRKKFTRIYDNVAETVLGELIRLAELGYKNEKEIKEKFEKNLQKIAK